MFIMTPLFLKSTTVLSKHNIYFRYYQSLSSRLARKCHQCKQYLLITMLLVFHLSKSREGMQLHFMSLCDQLDTLTISAPTLWMFFYVWASDIRANFTSTWLLLKHAALLLPAVGDESLLTWEYLSYQISGQTDCLFKLQVRDIELKQSASRPPDDSCLKAGEWILPRQEAEPQAENSRSMPAISPRFNKHGCKNASSSDGHLLAEICMHDVFPAAIPPSRGAVLGEGFRWVQGGSRSIWLGLYGKPRTTSPSKAFDATTKRYSAFHSASSCVLEIFRTWACRI